MLAVSKIYSPKDSKRSLNFFSQENNESERNHNLSSELNGVLPLSQTSVVSFNLDDNDENQVCYCSSSTLNITIILTNGSKKSTNTFNSNV